MARCDDCLANKVCDHNRFGFENCGNFIPADVAPKSEVEWLYKQVDCLSQEVMYNDDIAKMKVDEAKAEVAREIFEEIEKELNFFKNYRLYIEDVQCMFGVLAELKVKYTEGGE